MSGLLVAAAYPGAGIWPLATICLVPLLLAMDGRTPAMAALLGLETGVVTVALASHWAVGTVALYTEAHPAIAALFSVGLWLLHGTKLAAVSWLAAVSARRGWSPGWAFALALPATEAFYPELFPWPLGATLHVVPTMMQVAEVVGAEGVSAIVVVANVACYALLRVIHLRGRQERRAMAVGVPCALLVAAACYGAGRLHSLKNVLREASSLKIAVVQANVDPAASGGSRHSARVHARATTELLGHGVRPDLVIWPEGALEQPLESEAAQAWLRAELGPLGVPILMGASLISAPSNFLNSALLVDERSRVLGRYDKQLLVPFAEYLPGETLLPALHAVFPAVGRYVTGPNSDSLLLGRVVLAVSICYEDAWSMRIRDMVRSTSPHVLVNISNDAWFRSKHAMRMRFAISTLRAVEHRRSVVRATPNGISAIIDPLGNVLGIGAPNQPVGIIATVPLLNELTLYDRWGRNTWLLALAVLAIGPAGLNKGERWLVRRLRPRGRP